MAKYDNQDDKNIQDNQELLDETVDQKVNPADIAIHKALRISFVILNVIMFVLIIFFLASGIKTVNSDEKAIVLQFGKIRGAGESRILGPGLHWIFPYPINEIIKIPTEKKINLPIYTFWYHLTREDMLPEGVENKVRISKELDPIIDGYCLIKGEEQTENDIGSTGDDYNIVHTKWQITYKIDDTEKFFKNVYVKDILPGEIYFNAIIESVSPLIKNLTDDAVVTVMVNYTIDEAVFYNLERISKHVKKLLQKKMDEIESGIMIVSVQLTESTWPRQVDKDFLASIQASQISQRIISESKGYAVSVLNEAAGPVAEELLAAIADKSVTNERKELLLGQLAGQAQVEIADAKAYRTKVVETAKANADYLQRMLPQYNEYPELVVQQIYQDAIEYVLENTDEKIIVQPTNGTKGREIRILLNKDPANKPKSEK